jgi:hypothetical protein
MAPTVNWTSLLLAPLLMLLGGAVLLAIGLRGRRVGDHPVCGRCGFDLFGNPGAARCPECGSDLGLAGAVRTGHRRRRRGPLWAGGILLLLGVTWAGLAAVVAARGVNLNEYKPVGWLLRDLESANPGTRDSATLELRSRFADGRLSDAQIARMTTRALDLQGDRSKPWSPGWGDLIESARAAGKLPDAAWARYARQAPVMGIEVRPRVRRGDPLPYWVVNAPARVGVNSRLVVRQDSRQRRVTVSGLELPGDRTGSYGTSTGLLSAGGTSKSGGRVDPAPLLDRLTDGPQTLRVVATMQVFDSWPAEDNARPPLATAELDVTVPWTLDPPDAPAVRVIRDDSLRPAVERALAVEHARFTPGNYPYLDLSVNVRGVPVGISYQVAVREAADGREFSAGGLACPKGTTSHTWGMNVQLNGAAAPDVVDVIFRPDVKAAAGTTDTFEVWDGEVVVKGVKVERPKSQGN